MNLITKLTLAITFLATLEAYSNTSIDSIQSLITHTQDKHLKIELMISLSKTYLKIDKEEAIKIANEALNVAKSLGYKESIAASYRAIAKGYFVYGNYGQSLKSYLLAIPYLTKTPNPILLARTYKDISLVYNVLENPKKALLYNQLCYKILKRDSSDFQLLINCYTNYADSYRLLNNTSKEILYFNRCIDIKNSNQAETSGIEYNKLGSAYWRLHLYDSAIKYYNIYLGLSIKEKDSIGIARANVNIGTALYSKGLYKNSLDFFNKALAFKQYDFNIGHTYLELANSYIKLNNPNQSIYYFNLAKKEKNVNLNELASCCEDIGNFYKNAHQTNKALEYTEISRDIQKDIVKQSVTVIEDKVKNETDQIEEIVIDKQTNELVSDNLRVHKENEDIQKKYNYSLLAVVLLLISIFAYFVLQVRKNYIKRTVIIPEIEQAMENNRYLSKKMDKDKENKTLDSNL